MKLIVVLSVFGLTGLQAQTMYVKEMSRTQTAYSLNNIQKMTFSSENVTVQKTDNTTGVFALNELRYLSFKNITTTKEDQPLRESKTNLISYPNPVTDILNIDLTDTNYEGGSISILTTEGKVVKTLKKLRTGLVTLNLSRLPQGIYICRYSNKTEVKTIKFAKQ
jgi:hypothetical protein